MKKYVLFLLLLFLVSCHPPAETKGPAPEEERAGTENPGEKNAGMEEAEGKSEENEKTKKEISSFINPTGESLLTRIREPEGYFRPEADEASLLFFLRNRKLKPDQSPVLLYNGRKKNRQNVHIAVFDLDVGDEDLQQCADSVMRLYCEYLWSRGRQEEIAFHLTNGFFMDYPSYREGKRLQISGNETCWSKTAAFDDSYETFRRYFRLIMCYAGTLSLEKESAPAALSDIRAGDLFIQGGSPGHCVMVCDIAKNSSGDTAFLLGQSYMPAQEFHLLKNPLHEEDPWYYLSELSFPLLTPEYSFPEGSFQRWQGWKENY
ncbi:MAG: DUF4846 domain-containing protein [Peptostreptococcaceae bacterium]|nr:DUF4846 domain-containing protein [Peptostreptococcaceae bacterium]